MPPIPRPAVAFGVPGDGSRAQGCTLLYPKSMHGAASCAPSPALGLVNASPCPHLPHTSGKTPERQSCQVYSKRDFINTRQGAGASAAGGNLTHAAGRTRDLSPRGGGWPGEPWRSRSNRRGWGDAVGCLPPATEPRGSVFPGCLGRQHRPVPRSRHTAGPQSPSERHRGPGAPSETTAAGENQTPPEARQWSPLEEGMEAPPKALDKHGDG